MMGALGPVEALARDAPACRLERIKVEADAGEPFRADPRYLELFLSGLDDEPARLQAAGDRDADLPREVIVAAATETKLARLRAQGLASDRYVRADRGELLSAFATWEPASR